MKRTTIVLAVGAVVLACTLTGVGVSLAVSGSSNQAVPVYAGNGYPGSGYAGSGYAGNGYAGDGYAGNPPQWMMGGGWPAGMMGGARDPGRAMGAALANAPGPRVSAADATRLGDLAPAGATVDRAGNRIVFTGTEVTFAVLAAPAGGPDETYRIAGLVNPTVVVPTGARVSIQVINADPDMAHGLVITAGNASGVWMPMTVAAPAFSGAALWALGDPTPAGMHNATLSFVAGAAGDYRYLCAVPGHAVRGMSGALVVGSD